MWKSMNIKYNNRHRDPKIEYRRNRKLPQIFSDGSKFTLKPEAKTEGNPTSETLLEHFFLVFC